MKPNASVVLNFWRENRVCTYVYIVEHGRGTKNTLQHVYTFYTPVIYIYDWEWLYKAKSFNIFFCSVAFAKPRFFALNRYLLYIYSGGDFSDAVHAMSQPFTCSSLLLILWLFYLLLCFCWLRRISSSCKCRSLRSHLTFTQKTEKKEILKHIKMSSSSLTLIMYSIGINKWKCKIRIVSVSVAGWLRRKHDRLCYSTHTHTHSDGNSNSAKYAYKSTLISNASRVFIDGSLLLFAFNNMPCNIY